MTGIVEKQLTFALEKVCKANAEGGNGNVVTQTEALKSTLRKICSKLGRMQMAKGFSCEDFLAKQIALGVKTEMALEKEEVEVNEDTIEVRQPIPVILSVFLINELEIIQKYVKCLLNEENSLILSYLDHIVLAKTPLDSRAFAVVLHIWIELLRPGTCKFLLEKTCDSSEEAQKEISNLINTIFKATKAVVSRVNLYGKNEEVLQEMVTLLKASILNYLKLSKTMESSSSPNREENLQASQSKQNSSALEAGISDESKFIQGDLLRIKYEVHAERHDLTHSFGNAKEKFEYMGESEAFLNSFYYQNLYLQIIESLADILQTWVETAQLCGEDISTVIEVLGIVNSILSSRHEGCEHLMNLLDMVDLLSLVCCEHLVIWKSLERMKLSPQEQEDVLGLLEKTETLPCTATSLLTCLKILESSFKDRATDTCNYHFWKKISKCLMKNASMDCINDVLCCMKTAYYPEESLFWESSTEKEDFLQQTRMLLNQMTAEATDLRLSLAQSALESPSDVLELILKRGVTSLAEAKICLQNLDVIYGLQNLKMPTSPGKSAIVYIIEKIWLEQMSINKEAAVEVICGIALSTRQQTLHPLNILRRLVLPSLCGNQWQVSLLPLGLGVFGRIATFGESIWTQNEEDMEELCAVFGACVVCCIQLLMTTGNDVLALEQKKIVRMSVLKLQKVFGDILRNQPAKWEDVFDILQATLNLNDTWQTIYIADLLCSIGKADRVLLPAVLGRASSQLPLGITNASPLLFIALFQVTCMNVRLGQTLCLRLKSEGEVDLRDLIYAVAETYLCIVEEEAECFVQVLNQILTLGNREKLKSLLPSWITSEMIKGSSCLLEKAGLVAVMAHAAVFLFNQKPELIAGASLCRKYARIVKIAFIDTLATVDLHAETVCNLLLAVLQQSFMVAIHIDEGSPECQVLCLELVNLFLDTARKADMSDQCISLCGCLHNLIKTIPQLNYRPILVQRITACMAGL